MKQIWRYILILIGVILLWNQVVLLPVRIISVIFHKLGHALTAFFSGYGYEAFTVTFGSTSDSVLQSNGWFSSFMISNGGYIGTLLFSVLIMFLKRTSAKRYILGVLAIIYLAIAISFPAFKDIILYPVIFASIIIVLYMIQNDAINEFVIEVIGISTLAYIIYDTFVNTLLLLLNQQFSIIKSWQEYPADDIVRLSRLTHFPYIVWGLIWLAMAILVFNAIILKGSKGKRYR